MKNGAVIELEAAWALNTLEVDEAKTSLCGTKAGADMKDGLRINYIHHNKQVVEKPALSGEGAVSYTHLDVYKRQCKRSVDSNLGKDAKILWKRYA